MKKFIKTITNNLYRAESLQKTLGFHFLAHFLAKISNNKNCLTRLKRNNIMNKRYTYDGLGRLTQEYNADFGTTFNYSYDNAGNITEKSYEQTNSQGQTEQIIKTYAYTNGRLTNYNGYTILYDEIGNPVTCFNNSLEWTHGHRLKKYYGAEFLSNAVVKPMMLPLYSTASVILDGVVPGLGTTLLSLMYGT